MPEGVASRKQALNAAVIGLAALNVSAGLPEDVSQQVAAMHKRLQDENERLTQAIQFSTWEELEGFLSGAIAKPAEGQKRGRAGR